MKAAKSNAGRNCGPFLIISRHDPRTRRKANMHFIAEELAKRGTTRFFSFGLSSLSRLRDDPRLPLWRRANTVETEGGMECYLWRTPLHPVNLRFRALGGLEKALFIYYRNRAPKQFRQWVAESGTIVFESGFPIIFIRLCRQINPAAKLLYIASDDLKTINCARFIVDEFMALAPVLDGLCLPSPRLADKMPPGASVHVVPHGMDKSIMEHIDPSPYSGGINAISIGSMLFDPSFFRIAAAAFPQVTFHVIGGGVDAVGLSGISNVKMHGEMPFLKTIPYIAHADIGIAPYCGARAAPFLADTSMKLMQYGFLGVPAVCPHVAAGAHPGRFGYEPGNAPSIHAAIRNALACGHFPGAPALDWAEVTDRILAPH